MDLFDRNVCSRQPAADLAATQALERVARVAASSRSANADSLLLRVRRPARSRARNVCDVTVFTSRPAVARTVESSRRRTRARGSRFSLASRSISESACSAKRTSSGPCVSSCPTAVEDEHAPRAAVATQLASASRSSRRSVKPPACRRLCPSKRYSVGSAMYTAKIYAVDVLRPRRDRQHAPRAAAAPRAGERRRGLGQARAPEPERLDEGPHGARDDRGRRARRAARAGYDRRRVHGRQHRACARARLPREGVPRADRHLRLLQRRADPAHARARRRARRHPRRRGQGPRRRPRTSGA